MKLLLVLMLVVSCGKKPSIDEHDTLPVPQTKAALLAKKAELYKKLQPTALDAEGWPHDCDSVGFLALCKTAGGCSTADYFDAEESDGKWQRNRAHNCVESGNSKTSISKDMLMMGFVYGLFGMDKTSAVGYFKRMEQYGREHDWVMGYPSETLEDLGRVYMTPPMIVTLYSILEKLTGKSFQQQAVLTKVPGNYAAHLRVLDVLIQGKIKGAIDGIQMGDLSELHDRDPKNALYQAAFHKYRDGEMGEVVDILLDEKLFPSDRLPTSSDRCESYLWQRDQGKDWAPCTAGKTHDGIDFLFAYWLSGVK